MNRDELLEFHQEKCEQAREIMKRKNADYTGDADSPFANFRACEQVGICSTEQGFLVRIMDKMKRMATFARKGVLKVKNEPVEDACIDILNYMILFMAWLKTKRKDD